MLHVVPYSWGGSGGLFERDVSLDGDANVKEIKPYFDLKTHILMISITRLKVPS